MILRIFDVQVYEGKEADFERFFAETAAPFVRGHEGLVSLVMGRPLADGREFSMVMVWESLAALEGFTGTEWASAVIHPDEVDLVESLNARHFYILKEADSKALLTADNPSHPLGT